jgi:hypothetical protein
MFNSYGRNYQMVSTFLSFPADSFMMILGVTQQLSEAWSDLQQGGLLDWADRQGSLAQPFDTN